MCHTAGASMLGGLKLLSHGAASLMPVIRRRNSARCSSDRLGLVGEGTTWGTNPSASSLSRYPTALSDSADGLRRPSGTLAGESAGLLVPPPRPATGLWPLPSEQNACGTFESRVKPIIAKKLNSLDFDG